MRFFLCLLIAGYTQVAMAAIDAYPFPNEEMQVRYDNLIAELRCPQCLNTNLAGSDAMIAQDLRREVHRMLMEGKSDDEILDFLHARYGDFILYRPRLTAATVALWLGPALFFVVAAGVLAMMTRRRRGDAEQSLSADEHKQLDELLDRQS